MTRPKEEILTEISELVKLYMTESGKDAFNTDRVPLVFPGYDDKEVMASLKTMLDYRLTMGDAVKTFEKEFAAYVGVKHGVMVNSGSSANLLALTGMRDLTAHVPSKRAEIIIPAIGWSTSYSPIFQLGMRAAIVDVDPETLQIDMSTVDRLLMDDTIGLEAVHMLGYSSNMDELVKFTKEEDLVLMEDACESHGAEYKGKKLGSFGDVSTFSFHFSHHMTTGGEGGMILSDNDTLIDHIKSLRAHGWVRERSDYNMISTAYPKIDRRFLFKEVGYNLRPTESQGAFGIEQLKKLDSFIMMRQEYAHLISKYLKSTKYLTSLPRDSNINPTWYSFPIHISPGAPFSRAELISYLEINNIETRPVMAGFILKQPMMRWESTRTLSDYPGAKQVDEQSFFIGMHQNFTMNTISYIISILDKFLERF